MIRTEHKLAYLLSLSVFLLSCSYYRYFSEALNDDVWESVGGFTRIIIPDTFLYKNIIDYSDPIVSVASSSIKNTLGPSLLWFAANGGWILVSFINSVLLCGALLYLAGTAQLLGVPQRSKLLLMALLALLPETIYYSVGALKEIPSLFFLTAFFFHYLKGARVKWLLFAVFSALFRYQYALLLLFFLIADRFRRRALIFAFLVLLFVSAIYPYTRSVGIFSSNATETYRELYGATGVGDTVESIRETVPVLSMIAVLVRIIQSIFESLLTFLRNPTFYENGDLSVIDVVGFVSAIILFRYWVIFLKRVGMLLASPDSTNRNILRLYVFCLVFIFPIAGFSFIHHRYLYPLTSLVLVAGAISRSSIELPAKS